jgi:hypothetical protein
LSYPGPHPYGAGHEGSGYQPDSRTPLRKPLAVARRCRVRAASTRIGYNVGMHRRTAFVSGLAVGYYLGSRAGRERYEQIRAVLDEIPIGPAVEKAQALVELAVVRIQEARAERSATVLSFPNASGE